MTGYRQFPLKCLDSVIYSCGEVALQTYILPNGASLPTSYINFAKQFGYGRALGEFLIYLPMAAHPDSLPIRSACISNSYLTDSGDLNPDFDIDFSLTELKVTSLYPFAMSENGYYLFWDISRMIHDEYPIFITDFRSLGFTHVADNLYELFAKMNDNLRYKEIFPRSRSCPLPAIFEPFKPII